jgi:hypothetical protein
VIVPAETATGSALSAFAGELVRRVQVHCVQTMGVPGHGAFGRIAQEIIESALAVLDPQLERNPGAGIPDCWYRLGVSRCACEIKYTDNGEVALKERDVAGMKLGGEHSTEAARLVVLDIAFPGSLWVFDAAAIAPGTFRTAAFAHLHQTQEAAQIAEVVERLLRGADVDLIADELPAKALIAKVAARLD